MKDKKLRKIDKLLAIILPISLLIIVVSPFLVMVFIYSIDGLSRPKGYQKFSGTFQDKNFDITFNFDPYVYNTQTKINKHTYLFGKYLSGSTWTRYYAVVTNNIENIDPAILKCLNTDECILVEPKKNFDVNGKPSTMFCKVYDYNKSFRPKAIEKQISGGTTSDYCVLYIKDTLVVIGNEDRGKSIIESVIKTAKSKTDSN